MAVTLTVNSTPFQYPTPGDEPGWGEAATGWATEVTNVLNSLLGPGDLLETTFTVANNVSSDTNITGLAFDTGTVRAAFIEYSIYRTTASSTSGNAESGVMSMVFDNSASSTNKWLVAIGSQAGTSGVTFSVTDAGQVQYQSTNISGATYVGTMKFKASSLSQ